MNESYGQFTVVPKSYILGCFDIVGIITARSQVRHDPLPIMLVPVSDQDALTIRRFNKVVQHFQFPTVNDTSLLILVIHCTICHL